MRGQQPGVGQSNPALVLGDLGDVGDRGGDLGPQMIDRVEVDVQFSAHAVARQRRDAAQPTRLAAEELRNGVRPTQIQVRVVLPGDADTTEHLNAVLGVGLGGLDADCRSDGGGDGKLGVIGGRGAWAASAAATDTCSERSSISAHRCLTAWKLPIGLPNCSRTFAYSVAVSNIQRARPAASAASTVAAKSAARCGATFSALAGDGIEHHPRQRPGEVRRRQRLDGRAVAAGVDEQPLRSGIGDHVLAGLGAEHHRQGAADATRVVAQVAVEREAGAALAGHQVAENLLVVDEKRGQRGRGNRAGDQRVRGLLEHRAQISDAAARAGQRLGHRDAEQTQFS